MTIPIPYAPLDTQFGVVCEHRPDGGVVITVPIAADRERALRRAGGGGPLATVGDAIHRFFHDTLGLRPAPPRAVLELTPDEFAITAHDSESGGSAPVRRCWPRRQIAALRANRYSNGLYLRVQGQIDTDLLADLDPPLVQFLGRVLEEAMARMDAGPHPP